MTATLAERRSELSRRLDDLRTKRGVAVLECRAFDSGKIAQVESELAALDDADSEARRRQLDAFAKAQADQLGKARTEIGKLEKRRLEKLAAAMAAAHEMVAAMTEFAASGTAIVEAARSIGLRPPLSLSPASIEERLSRSLAHALAPVCSAGNRFGVLSWVSPAVAPLDDWLETEKRASSAGVKALTQTETEE